MKTPAQRAAKRSARGKRGAKRETWYCAHCRDRHPINERCPIARRRDDFAPFGTPFGGLEIGVVAALAAAKGRR